MLRTIVKSRRSIRPSSALASQRWYATPTSSRLRPAEALATRDDDYSPEISYASNEAGSIDRSYPYMLNTSRHTNYRALTPFGQEKLTVLPSPLPDDQPISEAQAALYPSTSLLDSLSLIHICLGRQDTIPRAFDIFWTLLDDHAAHRTSLPDANVWASVIEGILSLDAPKQAGGRPVAGKSAWMPKAEVLIAEWEKFNGGRSEPGTSRVRPLGLGRGGEKVYAGYLRGLVTSGLSVSPILPYLHSRSLSLTSMMGTWSQEEKVMTLEALRVAAEAEDDTVALKAVNVTSGMEQDRRERLEKGMPVEVNPLPAVSLFCSGHVHGNLRIHSISVTSQKEPYTTTLMRQIGTQSADPDAVLPRFAIANLRATFKDIPPEELPLRRQEMLESASLQAARAEIENAAQTLEAQGLKDVADSQRLQSGKLQAWMWQWSLDLTKRLTDDIEALEKKTTTKGANKSRASLAQDTDLLLYLRLLSPEKMALVTILEVMRSSGSGGIPDGLKTLRGLVQVGKAVETEYRALTIQNMLGKDSQSVLGAAENTQDGQRAVNRLWRKVGKQAQSEGMGSTDTKDAEDSADAARVARLDHSQALDALRRAWTPDWTQAKHVAVGAFLMNALVDTAKISRTAIDEEGVEQ